MSVRTIHVKGEQKRSEALANEVITPGQVIMLISTGKVQKQPTEKLDVEMAVAVENDLLGGEVGDTYASGALVQYNVYGPGDEVNLILEDGENVVVGDYLEMADAGEVQKYTNGVKAAVALEAVDASDSAATPVASRRIKVRVM